MRLYWILFLFLILVISCTRNIASEANSSNRDLIKKIVAQESFALSQLSINSGNNTGIFPRSMSSEGDLITVGKSNWVSGFYPGILWMMLELTNDTLWANEATKYTEMLESEKYNKADHDIGFKMMSSYGNAYRLTGNKAYREILIQSARTLTTRFNEKVGCIRSWDHHSDKWDYPVIIDNMVNLELLFWASKETGDPVFANIAIKHAETCMKNHFRSDYSSYHVVSYDTLTGKAVKKQTHQGAHDESSWARGQAWALYGFTMAYRETNISDFLTQAENIAAYIINVAKLPDDYVPLWDFSLSHKVNEPKDVSAAAIIASALIELSTFSSQNKDTYLQTANRIINSLQSDEYFNEPGSNHGFLLKHSTGSKPLNSEVNVPLIYADYYFLEALLRLEKIQTNYYFSKH